MDANNETTDKQILLLGFQMPNSFKIPFFLLLIILYILTLSINIIIVALVSLNPNLCHPMYFFLSQLALSDIILTTNITPLMLQGVLGGGVAISIPSCIAQLQFFGIAVTSECLILAVMSYDRYLAICNPLHYISIMDKKLQYLLVTSCWFLSFLISFVTVIFVSKLDFCGSNVISHFFCDFVPLLQLSCTDTSAVELENLLLATPTTLVPALFIFGTYVYIFITILKIPSAIGKQKAFSTCSSHLAVVGLFFGTLVALYVVPSNGYSLAVNKILSLLYTVVTPLFNLLIYCLKNQELRVAFGKCFYYVTRVKIFSHLKKRNDQMLLN